MSQPLSIPVQQDDYPDEPRQIAVFQTHDQQRQAERASLATVMSLQRIGRALQILGEMADGEIADGAVRAHAHHLLNGSQDDAAMIAEFVHELAAQHIALLAMFRKAVEQRDEALRTKQAWLDDLADQIAEHQLCDREQAWTLLTVLLNSDEQLMQDDVVDNVDTLIIFRDELAPLLDNLTDDVSLPEEA